jgi:SpoVK/Ycf46/Vps4 family AAA+-type ATPase
LPDAGERFAIVRSWIGANCGGVPCDLDEEAVHGVVSITAGMTSRQIQAALAKSAINRKGLGSSTLTDVLAEKISVVKSSEVLRIVQVEDTVNSVGGLKNIKEYLARRRLAYGAAAERYGLPMPKGILLVGPPGTGKSLMAKVAANNLQLGLLHIDIGRLQGSLVGQSEERLRSALSLAEAQAPNVLWLDELEKAFGGVGGPSGDSGVLQRQFGYLLNWMQEHKSPVFLVATANDIRRLPPEFLRKGRFDEIFFVDLPTPAERSEILTVILRKHGQPAKGLVTDALIGKLERFTGAEIEAAVTEGMYNAFFDSQRPLAAADIEEAAAHTVPLADQRCDEINELRQWGRVNARPAS